MDQFEFSYKMCFWSAAGIAIIIVIMLLTGCKQVEYVTVEKVRTDTTYITKQQRDSIWLHDSLYIHEYQRGETIYVEKAVWHTAIQERLRVDTILKAIHDTIPHPYPVVKMVEKKLSWMQKALITIGILAIMALFLIIARWLSKHMII